MKRIRLTGLLYCAALVFFLTSCNSDGTEDKPTGDTNTTATDTKTPEVTTPVNTIITTPETMVIVTHKVANFQKWIVAYEGHDSARLANGVHSYVVGRGMMDSNMVMIALKADDLARAKAFTNSPGLKTVMQKAGVTGAPSISFITNTWQDTAQIGSAPRSMTTFTVKDWDNWQKNFNEGKQERIDNGIVDRVISHDADDNKKVRLVTALTDTAKAFAYYKSDALKKRREAGGVVGDPKRFLFHVVKRYR
jgi:hypothetical protein